MAGLLDYYKKRRSFLNQTKENAPYDIQFYNFWKQDIPDMWFYRFIQSRELLKGKNKKICFFSTFGERDIVGRVKGDVKVFFTGENLKRGGHRRYADHLMCDEAVDLSLGFEYFEDPKYLRFPLWMLFMFEPESCDEDIERRCTELNHPQGGKHRKFACHISGYDAMGLRGQMCEALGQIETVDCAGKLMHNCDDLWKVYGDDKMKFISEYKFNICPENSNSMGYVTEKVFQAVDAGCIPVYWGSYNQPEPKVLNPEAIVFWDKDAENTDTLELIRKLIDSESLFEAFARQNRLKEGAADYVVGKFHELEKKIAELL